MPWLRTKFVLRTLALFPLAIIACSLAAQDFSAMVTFSHQAAPVSKVVEALGKEAKSHFDTGPEVANETVVLSFAEAPLKEGMDRLAKAVGGEWVRTAKGMRLIRTDAVARAQQNAEWQSRAQELTASIKGLSSTIPSTPYNSEVALADIRKMIDKVDQISANGRYTAEILQGFQAEAPIGRALFRLLGAMDTLELARVGRGERMVFSTQPTRMQRALGNVQSVLRVFADEQLAYESAFETFERQNPNRNYPLLSYNGTSLPQLGKGEVSKGIGKVILGVYRPEYGDGLICTATVADTSGNVTATSSVNLAPAKKADRAGEGDKDDSLIEFSTLAKEYAASYAGGKFVSMLHGSLDEKGAFTMMTNMAPAGGDISPALRATVLAPETTDPAFPVGEALEGIAKRKGFNLVAVIPDLTILPLCRVINSKEPSVSKLLQALDQEGVQKDENGGWISFSPRKPVQARMQQVNRRALGTLLRTLRDKGYLSLTDQAKYAMEQTQQPSYGTVEHHAICLINPIGAVHGPNAGGIRHWRMLRFFGLITDGQKALLKRGSVNFSQFTPQQIAALADAFYNDQQYAYMSVSAQNRYRTEATLMDERTEALPAGLLGGSLRVSFLDEELAYGTNSKAGYSDFLSAPSLALRSYKIENPTFGGTMSNLMEFDGYRPAKQQNLKLNFELLSTGKPFQLAHEMRDHTVDMSVPAVPPESLPDSFRSRVQAVLEKARQAWDRH